MHIRYRNTFQKRFEGETTVQHICTFASVLDRSGWKLDISVHTDGIEIDADGITMHFVKTSDKQESVLPEDEFLFKADVALDLIRQSKRKERA